MQTITPSSLLGAPIFFFQTNLYTLNLRKAPILLCSSRIRELKYLTRSSNT